MIRQLLTGLGIWEGFSASGPLKSYGIRTAWEEPTPRHQDFVQNANDSGDFEEVYKDDFGIVLRVRGPDEPRPKKTEEDEKDNDE